MPSFLNPEQVLDQLNLRPDMVAAEFGCGSGGFAIPLAKRLEDGIVYAIDILAEPLSALKSRMLLENVTNIRVIRSDLEKPKGSTLNNESLDLVLIPNVLFQVDDKDAIITESFRVLKKARLLAGQGAKLLIIDWLPKAAQGPEKGRVSPDEVKKTAEKTGFKLEQEFKAGKYHYALVFEKK